MRKRIKKESIFCGQDFRELIGYQITKVVSNDIDLNVRLTLEDSAGNHVKIYLDDICFDGEHLRVKRWKDRPDNRDEGAEKVAFAHNLTSRKRTENLKKEGGENDE